MSNRDRTMIELQEELGRLRRRIAEIEAPCSGEGRENAGEAWFESKERYRSLFENVAVAMAVVDQKGHVVEANEEDCRFLGYPRSELIGMHFSQFTHPQDLDLDAELYGSLVNGERQGYEIEKRYVRKDGGVVWGRLAVSLIRDSHGAPLFTSVVCADITDRKRAEEALRNSQERLNFLMSNSPAVIYTRRPSGDFGATFVSPNVAQQLGYEAEAFTSDPGFWAAHIHPDDTQRIFDGLSALFARGSHTHEYRFRHKDGTWHCMHDELKLVRSEAGEPVEIIGSWIVITDRKRAEEALAVSEERHRLLLDMLSHGVQENDCSGVITYSNRAHHRILGYENGELVGKAIWQLLPPGEEQESLREYLAYLVNEQPKPSPYFTVSRKKDGSLVDLQIDWDYQHDIHGSLKGFISVITDVTVSKKAEENLRRHAQGLATLLEVSRSLAVTLDLEKVLQAATDGVTKLFGFDTAAVYLIEEDTLRLGATTPPLPPQFPEELRHALLADHPHVRDSLVSGKPVFVPDLVTADLTPAERAVAEQRDLRTVLFIPLIAGVKSVGTLIVGSVGEPRTIGEAEIYLCRTLANLAALSVENAGLYTVVRRSAADLEQQMAERRQAEEALRKSEEKYRTLFDSATDAVFILDLDGNFLDINRTAYTRLGYTKQEMLSMHITRLDPPEFAARVSERLAEIARYGAAVFESAHLRKDGSIMPVEINSRLLEYEGRQVYFSIVRDITDRKRAEDALRESEERFRSLLARVDSVAVQGFGPDGVVHYWNKASERLYGYTAEEAERRNILDLIVPPETREQVAGAIAQMAKIGSPPPSSEAMLLRKDGGRVTVYASYAVVNMQGRAPELYCVDIDITDRKQAEQDRLELERRLLHAQKLESLGILAGGIAHDFNNLLMAVLGNLDLALQKVSPVSPARVNIEQSVQAARRATDLTRQMLAYSGKGRFLVKAMDLSGLVEENTHLFRAGVARTATLDVRLGSSLPAIEADAGQVQQVIMNLITNASEAIGDAPGRITITTGVQECDAQCLKRSRIEDVPPPGRFIYLDVADTGCGMDEQTQQRLFDPFFTTKAPGRGLGMSAILGIVRGHGGAIFVESGPDRGTAIRILFPALEGMRAESGAVAGARPAEAGAPSMIGTVLVVDDEEIVRMVCREMVEAMGLSVLTAVDGRDAVSVLTRHADSITHVILDLSMPNMDGMAAFAELVRIKPGVKVIMSSGYDELESIQRMSGRGLAGFIQKPYSLRSLREALEKA